MPLYILILIGFGALTSGVLFFRHIWFADVAPVVKFLFAMLAFVIMILPALMVRSTPIHPRRSDIFWRHTLYAVYVCAVLLMTLTLVADMVCLGGIFGGLWKGGFCLTFGGYNFLLLMTAVGITVLAVMGGLKLPTVKKVVIASPKIHQSIKIAVLSDMHLHRTVSLERVKGIVERTNAAQPDLIVLTGDIVDDDPYVIKELLEPLKKLNAPRFFVTGNHEFYIGYNQSIDAIRGTGARLLENNGVFVGNVFLAGIPDKTAGAFWGLKADVERAFTGAPAGVFRVLLSHTPIDMGLTPPFDLEIAGHTHGGQVFPFHLLARLGNKFLAGLYRRDTSLIYVSRGAGQWGPQMRFLAPAEITLIELVPNK